MKNRTDISSTKDLLQLHAVLLFIQIVFGGFHVFGKYVLYYLHPLTLAGIRVLVATPLLLLIAWRIDRVIPSVRDFPYLALLGGLGVFVNQLLFVIGLEYTTAINAAILMPSIPVFAVALAVLGGVEKIGPMKLLGVFLAVAGALVMLNLAQFSLSEDTIFGNVLILINCISYAAFLVLQKPLLKRLPPLTVIAWAFLFGGTAVFLVSIPYLPVLKSATLPGAVYLGILYIVLLPTTINYALNTWAINRSSPSLVATYITLQPLAGGILAVIFLKESAGWKEVWGFLLIVAGLITVSRASRNKTKIPL